MIILLIYNLSIEDSKSYSLFLISLRNKEDLIKLFLDENWKEKVAYQDRSGLRDSLENRQGITSYSSEMGFTYLILKIAKFVFILRNCNVLYNRITQVINSIQEEKKKMKFFSETESLKIALLKLLKL